MSTLDVVLLFFFFAFSIAYVAMAVGTLLPTRHAITLSYYAVWAAAAAGVVRLLEQEWLGVALWIGITALASWTYRRRLRDADRRAAR